MDDPIECWRNVLSVYFMSRTWVIRHVVESHGAGLDLQYKTSGPTSMLPEASIMQDGGNDAGQGMLQGSQIHV